MVHNAYYYNAYYYKNIFIGIYFFVAVVVCTQITLICTEKIYAHDLAN